MRGQTTMPPIDFKALVGLDRDDLLAWDAQARGDVRAQTPYLRINLASGAITTTTVPAHETGTPMGEWLGHVRTIRLPIWVDASELCQWAMDNHIRLQAILDGYESKWDGCRHRGELTEETTGILWAIQHEWDEYQQPSNWGGLWDAADWLADVPTADLMAKSAAEWVSDAKWDGVTLVNIDRYLADRL